MDIHEVTRYFLCRMASGCSAVNDHQSIGATRASLDSEDLLGYGG